MVKSDDNYYTFMKKIIFPILLWCPFVLPALAIVFSFFADLYWNDSNIPLISVTLVLLVLYCGPLFLTISGILWIVDRIKFGSINKEFNLSEKEAEEALAAEIEAVKGNSLKKELVKRRLVREYIEKRRLEASQKTDYLKSVFLLKLADNYRLSGSFLTLNFLAILIWGIVSNFSSHCYWSIENVIFAVLAIGVLLCKFSYIAALVVGLTLLLKFSFF